MYLTETADPAWPRITTDVQTTPAAGQPDSQQVAPIQQALAQRELLPEQQLGDRGHVNGTTITARATRRVALLGPVQADTGPQARVPGGLTAEQFTFDYERCVATYPAGQASRTWQASETDSGVPVIEVAFPTASCCACPAWPRSMPTATERVRGRRVKIRATLGGPWAPGSSSCEISKIRVNPRHLR